jgi:hypothetical protein
MRIGLATCAALRDGWSDDQLLAEALRGRGAEATFAVWDDPAVQWQRFDLVLIRSTWDYTERRDDFVAWAEAVGERLRNPPAVVRWNSDKHYLAELESAGVPVVPTRIVEPGDRPPELNGEVVIKPAVSAGALATGRFGPGAHGQARSLLTRLGAEGRAAMVQPYLTGVDADGETAVVYFGGEVSHVLRKNAVLGPDEEAPVREDRITAAEPYFDEGLVGRGEADPRQRELAGLVLEWIRSRFGLPLYARVDLVPGPDGAPVLLELEAVEPNFYLATSDGAADRLATAVLDAARRLG